MSTTTLVTLLQAQIDALDGSQPLKYLTELTLRCKPVLAQLDITQLKTYHDAKMAAMTGATPDAELLQAALIRAGITPAPLLSPAASGESRWFPAGLPPVIDSALGDHWVKSGVLETDMAHINPAIWPYHQVVGEGEWQADIPEFVGYVSAAAANADNTTVIVSMSGGYNYLLRTTDGSTWTQVALPGSNTNRWNRVRFEDGVFLACGNGGRFAVSTDDGLTWTELSVPTAEALYYLSHRGGRIAVGSAGNALWWSDDQFATHSTYTVFVSTIQGLSYNADKQLLVALTDGSGYFYEIISAENARVDTSVMKSSARIWDTHYDDASDTWFLVGQQGSIQYVTTTNALLGNTPTVMLDLGLTSDDLYRCQRVHGRLLAFGTDQAIIEVDMGLRTHVKLHYLDGDPTDFSTGYGLNNDIVAIKNVAPYTPFRLSYLPAAGLATEVTNLGDIKYVKTN